ncbi:helix-turn-helix transcriptional regulator [Mesorhizobium sp. B2-3-4]|uniref:helix-turn-helix domain-containing protein n=1 Tax=Mesorhizobium sp. B2-3-4 TaxID=2589959 RepID=UPI00112A9AA5|nr:helix-turn-helix transcriptional regulator [Mesorhizobium sp. B2-3-4]TPM30033.1 helix-turn-helix transcriptional regulator [Mesorhizobium sp. B2-3-4]
MQFRKAFAEPGRRSVFNAPANHGTESGPHPADQYVGRQIAAVRVQSDVSQAQLARSIGISFQQLQKYENARNRVSASMLYEIASSLGVPVNRFFEGLPGNETDSAAPPLPVDERINFIASAEGRRLIEGLMQLHPRVRSRVSALIAALREELAIVDPKQESGRPGEPMPVERRLA